MTGQVDVEKLSFLSQLHVEAGNGRIWETQNENSGETEGIFRWILKFYEVKEL